ncbi:hypothetical protein M3603_15685 [Rummeliibacillus stabekisii]|uniref:hypothetical protein n=1 Tax=Rummeliibacillus stabekisii TaxID=241244 RepID=UPI00203C932F|nr:hypothetical protein [Rummeliibacillus stabekisii]MCM3318059.1 hypothetical protein [Rummeliibacillus stabekisii]
MAKAFNERRCIYVPATGGHPKNTEYRVAWGHELWEQPTAVTKVQMVYNNKVAGRLSPSFPDDTFDRETVISAFALLDEGKGTNSKTSRMVLVRKEKGNFRVDDLIDQTEGEILDMYRDMYAGPITPVVNVELDFNKDVDDNILEMLFRVDIS